VNRLCQPVGYFINGSKGYIRMWSPQSSPASWSARNPCIHNFRLPSMR